MVTQNFNFTRLLLTPVTKEVPGPFSNRAGEKEFHLMDADGGQVFQRKKTTNEKT